jgi:hypothetical protein
MLPNEYFYPSQTKILEGRTNLPECVFEALFRGVSTRFGLRIVENCFEHTFGKVGSSFQNLRLGSIILENETAGRACIFDGLCEGESTSLVVLIDVLIYVFHTHFYGIYALQTKILDGLTQPSATSPLFSTISILNISTKASTWIRG